MNFANWPKKNKRRTFCFWKKMKFASKNSYAYADCSFDYHVLNLFDREPKKVRSLSKRENLKKLDQKDLSPQNIPMDT